MRYQIRYRKRNGTVLTRSHWTVGYSADKESAKSTCSLCYTAEEISQWREVCHYELSLETRCFLVTTLLYCMSTFQANVLTSGRLRAFFGAITNSHERC